MAKKEKQSCDVLISGGGIPGLTLSALLSNLGLHVIVIDPNPPIPAKDIRADGRTSALMAGSVSILKSAGLWDRAHSHGAALETLRIIESATARADFHAADIGLPFFGINMPNNILRALLSDNVKQAELISIASDEVGLTATLNTGSQIRTRLLVGADGRASRTRDLCNIDIWERDYGQHAITCIINHSKSHQNISTEFHRPGGPFTIVPLPGDQSSIVWVEYADDAEAFIKLSKQNFEQALQDRTEGLVGKIALASNPTSWPLKAMRAKSLTAPRTALVAEAAHVLHPLGAQGLNLSLRDVATLAEEIADAARSGLDIGSSNVLNAYEFRRKADVLTRLWGTDSLNRMVSNDISLLKILRSAGLKTINAIEPLRRFAMNEGIIPGYDDSRLSRGEPL